MDGFTAGMDQFLVILQLSIRELKQALLLARQKANPPSLHKSWERAKETWKLMYSGNRACQDKIITNSKLRRVTNVSPEWSLRNVPSLTAATFVAIGTDGGFFTSSKRFLSGWTYFNPLHTFVPCHLQGQNLTTLRICFCCVTLRAQHTCSQGSLHISTQREESAEERRGEPYYNTHAKHMHCHRRALEMVIDDMVAQLKYAALSRRLLFRTCSFWCL